MAREITFAIKAPNWLGDAVMALPAVSSTVECSRRGRVVVLCSEVAAAVYSRLEGTLPYGITRPGGGPLRSIGAIYRGSAVLRSLRPVIALSLTRSFTSAAMCYLGKVPRRVGFEDSTGSSLYTDRVRRPSRRCTHLIDIYNEIVQSVGIPVSSREPRINPLDEDIARGRQVLEEAGCGERPFVLMFPGARYGPAKMWPPGRFALLGDRIADRFNLEIVLAGGRQERSACHAVESAMRGRVVNVCGGTDLPALIGMLWLSSGVVSNDSGGMHLSAALGKPVVGLFFSTDPAWTGPVSETSVALYRPADCSPCFERDCRKGNICTETIGEEEVLQALARVARLKT